MKGFAPWFLALALLSGACAKLEDPQALLIRANAYVSSTTGCKAQPTGDYRGSGIMDIAAANTYWLYPQVENRLPVSSSISTTLSPDNLRMNNDTIQLIGAAISYDYDVNSPFAQDVGAQIEKYQGFFSPVSVAIDAGGSAATGFPAIPFDLGNAFAGAASLRPLGGAGVQMILRVVVQGLMSDRTLVRSNEMLYPIFVCNGCLVFFPPDVDCTTSFSGSAVPCVLGQDAGLDCRLCYLYALDPVTQDRCQWLRILRGEVQPLSDMYKALYGHQAAAPAGGGDEAAGG